MKSNNRQGVALIIVIGMLALMVILGVTFSIYMRTERVAAGSFKSGVVSRQLIPVALNWALAAINDDLGNKPYPRWYYLESPGSTVVPGVTNASTMAWIPRAALGPNQNPAPRWIDIAGVDGRVAYLVVNCSGLLDANVSGANGIARSIGTNVNEIQLSACPDVADVAKLVADRPYETVQELAKLGTNSGALNQCVSNFVCFSSFPSGYPGGTNISLVDLSGDENALMGRHTDIVNGLIASGIAADQAEFVFTNLLDYVDADNIPRALGSACTEAVPMFNEVYAKNLYSFDQFTNLTMTLRLRIESYYPFVKPSANSYWMEYNIDFGRAGSTPASFPLPESVSNNINIQYTSGDDYKVPVIPNIKLSITNYANCIVFGNKVQLKVKVSLKMHENGAAGDVVDAAPYPSTSTLDLDLPEVTVPAPPAVGAVSTTVEGDMECTDPRFNWNTAQWVARPDTNTLGTINVGAAKWLTARDTDGYGGMYVANRSLGSVSELTYLLRGQSSNTTEYYWNTIRLFDWLSPNKTFHSADRVLDYFMVGTNTLMKGFVNPNSGATNVLTAVFKDMPINSYPDESPVTLLTSAQAETLAAFWADTNQNPWRCNFANLSDIGHATNVFGYLPVGLTPFQKESFFRNTAGLFNTRQQYFKILLFAQAAKVVPLMPDKSVLSDMRAIAEVWRDPLPNAEGIHPCVVRMVTPLNND